MHVPKPLAVMKHLYQGLSSRCQYYVFELAKSNNFRGIGAYIEKIVALNVLPPEVNDNEIRMCRNVIHWSYQTH